MSVLCEFVMNTVAVVKFPLRSGLLIFTVLVGRGDMAEMVLIHIFDKTSFLNS